MKSTDPVFQTAAGKDLLNVLHDNFWDVLSQISAINTALENAAAATDAQTKEVIEAKLAELRQAKETIGSVSELIDDIMI